MKKEQISFSRAETLTGKYQLLVKGLYGKVFKDKLSQLVTSKNKDKTE